MRATEIAQHVDGRLEGGGDPEITGVAPLDRAGPTDLSFLAHPRYVAYVDATKAGVLLVPPSLEARVGSRDRIVVADVHRALAALLPRLYPPSPPDPGVHPTVVIGRGRKAVGMALNLTTWTRDIVICTNGDNVMAIVPHRRCQCT